MKNPNQESPSPPVCPRCLALIIKIRRGEITGAVLSCHPLEEIADLILKPYIVSKEMRANRYDGGSITHDGVC